MNKVWQVLENYDDGNGELFTKLEDAIEYCVEYYKVKNIRIEKHNGMCCYNFINKDNNENLCNIFDIKVKGELK